MTEPRVLVLQFQDDPVGMRVGLVQEDALQIDGFGIGDVSVVGFPSQQHRVGLHLLGGLIGVRVLANCGRVAVLHRVVAAEVVVLRFHSRPLVAILRGRELLRYFLYLVLHSLEQRRVPPPGRRVEAHKLFVILQLKIIKVQSPIKQKIHPALHLLPIVPLLNRTQIIIKQSNNIKMHEASTKEEQGQPCYFCKESDIRECVTRSLYHKYNDSSSKILHRIDQLVEMKKEKSLAVRKFEEIKHIIDDSDQLSKYLYAYKAKAELTDLLEYYKFRKFVPVFAKSLDNVSMTEELHVYYYDKLKLYYNEIKKKLNITVDQSSLSSSSNSFVTKSEISMEKSQILDEITTKQSKENMRQYETESKALEELMNILKKNEDRLKRIKSLRTEDCSQSANPFKDNIQRKSNLINYLASESRAMAKRSKKVFFKYIEEAKAQRTVEQTSRIKSIKKLFGDTSSRNNTFYESLKLRSNSESVSKLRKDNSRTHVASNERILFRNKAIIEKERPQRKSCENLIERQVIKSLPKVQMNLNIRPVRSTSSTSIMHPGGHQPLPKKLIVKKQLDYAEQVQMIKSGNPLQQSDRKKKGPIKTGTKIEIDQSDNLASINKKKIEELKMRAQRKKETRDVRK